jgi:Holliday junction resolvase RusA-like endonuclease
MKGGKARVVSTADPKAKLWRDAVQEAFRRALEGRKEWAGMVDAPGASVVLTALFRLAQEDKGARGQGAMKAHTAKPDLDNLMKLVMDAAQDAGVFGNGADPDAKVAGVHATKVWAEPGAGLMPGVCVTVSCVRFRGEAKDTD